MPKLGIPDVLKKNAFSNIKMREKKDGEEAVGKALNQLSKSNDPKFVDRKTHNKMGKDEFLKLLTYQLANQDPMKPMDQKKFASELAQFSSLEQLTNMNSKLEALTTERPGESKFYSANFLGKKVRTNGTTVQFDGEKESMDIPFNLPKKAKAMVIQIFDKAGQMVGQIDRADMSKGTHTVKWDARGVDGLKVTKGDYRVEVRGWDEGLNPFKAETKSEGLVTGVDFVGGETVLTLDGSKKIFLRDVDGVQLVQKSKKLGAEKAKVYENMQQKVQ